MRALLLVTLGNLKVLLLGLFRTCPTAETAHRMHTNMTRQRPERSIKANIAVLNERINPSKELDNLLVLHFVEVGIKTSVCEELFMPTRFFYFTVIEHNNFICFLYCG